VDFVTRLWTIFLATTLVATASAQRVTKLYVPQGVGGDAGRAATLVYGMETAQLITELQPTHDAGLAVANADSSEVWIFAATGTSCDVFNTATDKILRTMDVQCQVINAVFSPDGRFCFVIGAIPGRSGNSLVVIDRVTSNVALTVTEIADPAAVAVTPDSKALYCASPSTGTVTKIEIPSFKPVQSLSVGFEPSGLILSPDGKLLFVVCRGLDSGKRGGSQITVVDTRNFKPFWVLDVGRGCLSAALSPDMALMAVTYSSVVGGVSENVRLFKLRVDDDSISISRSAAHALGQAPQSSAIVSSSRYWIASDPVAGGVLALDLKTDTPIATYAALGHPHALGIAAVNLHVDEAISSIKTAMATEGDSARIADYYLDLAYLQKTANRKNDMVAAYQKVINDFPTSFAAISSGLQLADICFVDQLYGQAADYSFGALDSYQRFLIANESEQRLPENRLLTAVDR
jgi:DNA-binding beta-propeller fold protein YncE